MAGVDASNYDHWNRKRKLITLLTMLVDDESPLTVDRQIWTREWILRREQRGTYHTIFRELAIEDTSGFSEYMRMPYQTFQELVRAIEPKIIKQETCSKLPSDR